MHAPKSTDSGMVQDFFHLDPMEDPDNGHTVHGEAEELVQTSSHLMAWHLCHFHGCQVVRRTFMPKGSLFGGVTYKTTWWLHY